MQQLYDRKPDNARAEDCVNKVRCESDGISEERANKQMMSNQVLHEQTRSGVEAEKKTGKQTQVMDRQGAGHDS